MKLRAKKLHLIKKNRKLEIEISYLNTHCEKNPKTFPLKIFTCLVQEQYRTINVIHIRKRFPCDHLFLEVDMN